MITLNRPYHISTKHVTPTIETLYDRDITWLYSSREGLNMIYQHLYKQRGSLRVAVSPLTCFVALYPIINNGHTIEFVDINESTFNINEDKLPQLTNIDVLQLIYLGGNPIAMDKILAWAKANNVVIIEDCAQALGSTYQGLPVGTFGDYAVYSSVKNLYAVAGGFMLSAQTINSDTISKVHPLVYIYKHMKHWLEAKTNAKQCNLWNAIYKSILKASGQGSLSGTKIHTLSSSLVNKNSTLLTQAQQIQSARTKNADLLLSLIDQNKYTIQQEVEGAVSCRNRIILLSKNRLAKDLINDLRELGIAANNLTQSYLSAYQKPVFEDQVLSKYYTTHLDVYEKVLPHLLTIPSSPALTYQEIEYIANQVNKLG